jgi:hypothetical protein
MAFVAESGGAFIEAFVDAWARAEQRGDVTLLSELLDADFVGIDDGELLDKERWLARYRSGGLVHHAFCWRTIDANVHERGAFVVGRLDHSSSSCGHDASGRRTVTLTAVLDRIRTGARAGPRWQLAGLHASAFRH